MSCLYAWFHRKLQQSKTLKWGDKKKWKQRIDLQYIRYIMESVLLSEFTSKSFRKKLQQNWPSTHRRPGGIEPSTVLHFDDPESSPRSTVASFFDENGNFKIHNKKLFRSESHHHTVPGIRTYYYLSTLEVEPEGSPICTGDAFI